MPSTVTRQAPTARRRSFAVRELVFDLDLHGDDPACLVRVLATLRRRQCVITRVDYGAADAHRPGWLTIVLRPPARHAQCVEGWLCNLVDVTKVQARPA
jgi:acetolactate synthase small subunit